MASFVVLFSIRDAKGETSTTEVGVPNDLSIANLGIFAQQMALLINPLINGAITRIGAGLVFDLPGGLRATPAVGADVEEGAKFQFRTAGGYFTGLRLPTINEAVIATNSRDVDLADAGVAAFVNAMIGGINLAGAGGTGTVGATDKREDDIIALEFAREQFIKSRG